MCICQARLVAVLARYMLSAMWRCSHRLAGWTCVANRGCTPCAGWNKVQKEMQAGGPNAPVQYTPPPAAPGGWGGGRGPNIPGNGDFLAKVQAGAKNLK